MADKVVHTWQAGGGERSVSLFGVTTASAPELAVELAKMALRYQAAIEALTAARLESPNRELHSALEGVSAIAKTAAADVLDSFPEGGAVILRADAALAKHRPSPAKEVPEVEGVPV
jgi:hypothetical protein